MQRLSRTVPLSAVFAPGGRPLVYSHDANRAVRAAAGRYVVGTSGDLPVPSRELVAALRAGLEQRRIGMLTGGGASGTPPPWAMQRKVFWELGGWPNASARRSRTCESSSAARSPRTM